MSDEIEEPKLELTPTERMLEALSKGELDEQATLSTLGRAHKNVSKELMLDMSSKLLKLSRGEAKDDVKDSLEYQKVYGAHDYLSERILMDPGFIARNMLWKVTNKGTLKNTIPPSVFDKHISAVQNGTLNMMLESINPLESRDQAYKITKLGPGGIASLDSVPDESRNIQASYLGYIDPSRAPESAKIGIDNNLAHNTKFSSDGNIWQEFLNPKTKKYEWINARTSSKHNIAFPDSMASPGKKVAVLNGTTGIKYVPREEVDYVLDHASKMFSSQTAAVPAYSGIKGMRLLMGAKHVQQALPLRDKEAPFVSNKFFNGDTTNKFLGNVAGHVTAERTGIIKSVTKDKIVIDYGNGDTDTKELYHNFPYARKTFITQTAAVTKGQVIKKGETLATSNYNTAKGEMALGKNFRVAYMPYKGLSHEDGIVISASAAKGMTSEHMYATKYKRTKDITNDKRKYMGIFPGTYTRETLDKMDDNGVVKVGTVVNEGDPLVLGIKTTAPSPGTMGRKLSKDATHIWEHHDRGIVTDVAQTKDGYRVYIRTNSSLKVSDKIAGRFGNKGTIAAIIADNKMPKDKNGKAFDVLLNPVGIVSRTNSAQLVETALGKIVEAKGKNYEIEPFIEGSLIDYANEQLAKAGLKDTETVHNPESNRDLKDIFTGNAYFYKLHHTAEAKIGARSTGAYTQDGQPSKGAGQSSQSIGGMEIAALVSHGATEIMKDFKLIKGQENDDYWRKLKLGQNPKMPKNLFIYDKFKAQLKAGGINIYEDQDQESIFAMTNDQVAKMTSGREIKTAETYNPKTFEPIAGGLFGAASVGGAEGNHFGYIQLDEPILNPIMEDNVKSVLGLSGKDFTAIIDGTTEYKKKRGGHALKEMLRDINMDQELTNAFQDVKTQSGAKRDKAIKKLRALQTYKDHEIDPDAFMLDRVPVLPPTYRPIVVGDTMNMAADVNYLYRELIYNRDDYRDGKGVLDPESMKEVRSNLYNNYKAVVGLSDPTNRELKQKEVKGIFKTIFGSSPKLGQFQKRMIGGTHDLSGRAAATPNPDLTIDQVGLPEKMAWKIYEPFILKDLITSGYGAQDAAKAVAAKNERAFKSLQRIVEKRPVLINRAPTMHKYSIMALNPVLIKEDTIQMSPAICTPYNLDFDGDTLAAHVPVSDEAVSEAYEKMLPSKNLKAARDFKLMYKPTQEYIWGAHFATKKAKAGMPTIFRSRKEAQTAYLRGEIAVDDPVRIVPNANKEAIK